MNKQDIKQQPINTTKSPPKTTKSPQKQLKQPLLPEKPQKKQKIEVQVSKSTKVIVPRASTQNIACVVILLLIIPASIIYTNSNWVPTAKYYAQQFDFQVYCPVYYDINYKLKQQRDATITGWIMQHVYTLADQIAIYAQLHGPQQKRMYVIQIMDHHNQTNSTNYGMRYCGLARPRTGTCQKDAKLICTNPGPIFQATKDQQIIVIWINGIKKLNPKFDKYMRNLSSCHGYPNISQQRPNFCTLKAKLPEFKHLVYEDPSITPPTDHYQNFTIDDLSTPISTYMHGMAVRPSFNGGPLSWFTSKGQVGLGYSTAQRQNADVMRSLMRRNMKMNQILTKRYKVTQFNYKIDIYSNRQPPTTLLYYDSALNIAKKNLISGLSGMYIIRDKQIQKQLPSGQYEHFILIHPSAAQSLEIYDDLRQQQKENNQLDGVPQGAQSTFEDYMIFRDSVYRIRLANADFAAIYHNLRFIYKEEIVQEQEKDKKNDKKKQDKKKGKDSASATPQSQTTQPVYKQIQFYVIAADGILRNTPIGPLTKLDMIAPAQRFDILITFNKSLPTKHVKLVHGKHDEELTTIYLSNQTKSQGLTGPSSQILTTIPSAIYFNFSSLDSQVVRRRMRPFAKTSDNHIATNGHLTISQGKSQDPILGSVEDWYFINNINSLQSMHVDLIDFQIMDQYKLNQVPNTNNRCTFYNVDFFMKYAQKCTKSIEIDNNRTIQPEDFSKFVGENLTDYQSICKYISNLNKTQYSECFDGFANEHEIQGTKFLSGIDVEQICQSTDKSAACTYRYKADENQVVYKYRGEQIPIPDYRQGWKDVTVVPPIAYTRIRIRWTRNDFPETQNVQNQRQRQLFFYASEEQLGEFPGYTYRSTQVIDEESHMIRPIMVRPHSQGSSKTWKQIYDRINKGMFNNYKARIYSSWHDDDDFL